MNQKRFFFLTIFLGINFLQLPSHGAMAINELWSEASLAYKNGDYMKAAEYFSQAAQNPSNQSWQAHFNAGNAFFKAADYAQSLDHYWKAFDINPRPKILWRNLEIATARVGDAFITPGTPRILFRCWNFLTLDEWILLSLSLWLSSAFCFGILQIWKLNSDNHWARSWIRRIGFLSLAILVVSLPSSIAQYYSRRRPWLILQGPGLLRTGPSESLPVTIQVPEGRFVYVTDQNSDGWLQIETRREKLRGWMRP